MGTDSLTILLVDGELASQNQIVNLIQSDFTNFPIIVAIDTNEAILKIIGNSPDLILISYPLIGTTENELFELIKTKLPEVTIAFIANSKDFARRAIQQGIYKYILKPIKNQEISNIIKNALDGKQASVQNRLDKAISSNFSETKLRFLTGNGYVIINPEEVIFCKASGYHTELYLINKRMEFGHQQLIKFEESMVPFGFIRISRTHLINPRFIKRVFKKGSSITLSSDGVEYELKAGRTQLKMISDFNED
jgi:Response regulator of the LytR/AlgR family